MSMQFDQVIQLIKEEREFQDGNDYSNNLSLGEEITLLNELVIRVTRAYYDMRDIPNAHEHITNFIRKIASNCVRTMEHHGAPERMKYTETYRAYSDIFERK